MSRTPYMRARITGTGRYHVFLGPVVRVSLCGRARPTSADVLGTAPMWTWDEPHPVIAVMETCGQCHRIWAPVAKRRYEDGAVA